MNNPENRILILIGIRQYLKQFIPVSMVFGVNELFKNIITYIDRKSQHPANKGIIPMSHVFLSGILTGILTTLVLTPADHIRILLQKEVDNRRHRGSISAGRHIYRQYGVRGLYLGFNPTFIRQVMANAVYFYSYEYVMRLFAGGESSYHAPILAAFLAGGIAGSNSWLLTYPIDYIKTVMQLQDLGNLKYRSIRQCAVENYRKEGYRAFFKGLGVTMVRSFPFNGMAFFSFECVMRFMGWKRRD